MKTTFFCNISANGITRSLFTFRELRSFRALYVSQILAANNPVVTGGVVEKDNHSCLSNDHNKSSNNGKVISYTYFGNAEATSPAHRRRFRESLKASLASRRGSINQEHKMDRQFFHYPAKRAKLIYSFGQFKGVRSLLVGGTLCRSIKSTSNESSTSFLANSFSAANKCLIGEGNSNIKTFEARFKYLPTFVMGGPVPLISTSMYSRKKKRSTASRYELSDLTTTYLHSLETTLHLISWISRDARPKENN